MIFKFEVILNDLIQALISHRLGSFRACIGSSNRNAKQCIEICTCVVSHSRSVCCLSIRRQLSISLRANDTAWLMHILGLVVVHFEVAWAGGERCWIWQWDQQDSLQTTYMLLGSWLVVWDRPPWWSLGSFLEENAHFTLNHQQYSCLGQQPFLFLTTLRLPLSLIYAGTGQV